MIVHYTLQELEPHLKGFTQDTRWLVSELVNLRGERIPDDVIQDYLRTMATMLEEYKYGGIHND